jgi:hypothetical protein
MTVAAGGRSAGVRPRRFFTHSRARFAVGLSGAMTLSPAKKKDPPLHDRQEGADHTQEQ